MAPNQVEVQQPKPTVSEGDSLVNFILRFEAAKNGKQLDQGPSTKILKGVSYLERKCSALVGFQCKISQSRDLNMSSDLPVEIFTSGVIHDLVKDTTINPSVLNSITDFIKKTAHAETQTYNFFTNRKIMADDVDSTTVSLWALLNHPEPQISKPEAISVAKKVLKNTTPEGVIETFFPPYLNRRGQIDCATLSNVLRAIYLLGLDSELDLPLEPTEDFVQKYLEGGDCGFENGLYYYDSVDAFYFFLTNTLTLSERARVKFSDGLKKHVRERFGANSYPIDIAMRIITAINLNLIEDDDIRGKVKEEVVTLMGMQNLNGSWPADSMYRFKGWYFGCKTLSTAFAVHAIKLYSETLGEL